MNEAYASGISITFTPVYEGKFLFVQRQYNDDILPGYWCFPGGKVHVGETLAAAIKRECLEETALQPTGRTFFVDSYLLGDRVGAHFAIEVASDDVILDELEDYAWVDTIEHLRPYALRIPGIDTHLHYIIKRLREAGELAWQDLDEYDLVKERFLNK
jgi:8-oxo-dGTP pyrophosphatase MutT (NUDIX family)